MKIVVLDADTIINGVPRSRGEIVSVPDDFAEDVRRVVAENVEQRNRRSVQAQKKKIDTRKKEERFQQGLRKLNEILRNEHRPFWQQWQRREDVRQAVIGEMRERPQLLQRALDDTQWFVDEMTERFRDAKQNPNGNQNRNRNERSTTAHDSGVAG